MVAYQTTTGIIQSLTIERIQDPNEKDYLYQPNVQFTYTVDGKTYTSNRIYNIPVEYTASHVAKIERDYAEGRTVTVYYDLAKPDEGFLQKSNFRNLGIVFAFVLIGVPALCMLAIATFFIVNIFILN